MLRPPSRFASALCPPPAQGLLAAGCGATVGLGCAWPALWPLVLWALFVWLGLLQAAAPHGHRALLFTALGLCAWSLTGLGWAVIPVRPEAPWRPVLQAGLLVLVLAHHLLCALPGWLAGRLLLRRAPAERQVLLAWGLALASAEALRPLGWWGHGYGGLATALVEAPGSQVLLPWLSGLGWAGVWLCLCVGLTALAGRAGRSLSPGLARRARGPAGLLLASGLGALSLAADRDATTSSGPTLARADADTVTALALGTDRDRAAPWTAADRDAAMARLMRALAQLPAGGVLATAETYLPQSAPESPLGAWGELLAAVAARQGDVLLGMPQWVRQGDAAAYPVNAVLHLAPARQAVYGKARLVPLGEYLPDTAWSRPLARWFFASARGEQPAPAALQAPLFVAGHPVGVLICHELSLPDLARDRALAGDWLLVAADDNWVGRADYLGQMRALLRLRALETGRPILRVASGGPSLLATPDGRLQRQPDGPGAAAWPVRFQAPMTPGAPALRWGPGIALLPWLVLLALLWRIGPAVLRAGATAHPSPLQEWPHADAS
ncbi:nitrilase-related carbon-nitrogen hydrolase [Ideonella dechloratans]|uniref:nitrilase-related carbon-nitrogen hydrolase n=1 Tax=Ideonella dechloratans TaxID=36863 RepID=UPI0035ADD499